MTILMQSEGQGKVRMTETYPERRSTINAIFTLILEDIV